MQRLRRNRARVWVRRVVTYMLAAGRFVVAGRRRADRYARALKAKDEQEKEGYECKVCGVFCEPTDLESFYQHMRGRRHGRKLRITRARARLRRVVTCMLAAGRFVVAGRRRAGRRGAGDENFWAHWDRLTVLNMKVALVRRELARNRRGAAIHAATVMFNGTLRVARARVIATNRRRAARRARCMRVMRVTRLFKFAAMCFFVVGRQRAKRRRAKQLYQKSMETRCVVCLCAEKTHTLVPCGHKCLCRGCAEKQKLICCPICRGRIQMVMGVKEVVQGCVLCSGAQTTHALVPCGHKCLCRDCAVVTENKLNQLPTPLAPLPQPRPRCPLCTLPMKLILQIYD